MTEIYFENRHRMEDTFTYEKVEDGQMPTSDKLDYHLPMNDKIQYGIDVINNITKFPVKIVITVPEDAISDMDVLNKYLYEHYMLEIEYLPDDSIDMPKNVEEMTEEEKQDYINSQESDYEGSLFYNSDLRSISGQVEDFCRYSHDTTMTFVIDSKYYVCGSENYFLQLCNDADSVGKY